MASRDTRRRRKRASRAEQSATARGVAPSWLRDDRCLRRGRDPGCIRARGLEGRSGAQRSAGCRLQPGARMDRESRDDRDRRPRNARRVRTLLPRSHCNTGRRGLTRRGRRRQRIERHARDAGGMGACTSRLTLTRATGPPSFPAHRQIRYLRGHMSDRSILRTLPALAAFAVLQLPPLLYVSTVHAGLTHEWPADGDALDAVGDADGTLSGGTTFGQGLFDEAFVFDGVDDEVSFGQTAGNFGNSDFTIAFVIRTTSTGVVEGVLGKRSVCAFGSFWDIRTRGHGDLSLEVYETDTNLGTTTTRPINDGLFHTVVFTREGTVMRSYVDGFLDQEIDRGTAANV